MRKFLRRFFVSSTFRDFHAERDLLSQVINDFREEARKHGEETAIVDLRWGLDNFGLAEQDVVSKVLSVCLDEIYKSRPFMIIFLGDRFGFVPDRNLVTEEFAKKFDSVTDESVTALEIKYGLEQIKNPRCIICLRDIPHDAIPERFRDVYIETEPISREKLRELKKRLKKNYANKIIEYTAEVDPDTGEAKNFFTKDKHKPLGEAILSKILEDCADDWQKYDALPWQRRELEAADNFVASRADLFVGKKRKALAWDLIEKLENSRCLFLRGSPGTGKTSLACKLADTLRKIGRPVCFLQADSSPQISNAQSALQQVIYFLREDVLHLPEKFSPPTDYEGLKKYLATLCEKLTTDMKVYFFVDAIERMSADEFRNKLEFLPLSCENVHCLVTCTHDFEIPKFLFNPAATMEKAFNTLDDVELYKSFLELANIDDAEFDKRMHEAIRLQIKTLCDKNLSEEDFQEVDKSTLASPNMKKEFLAGMRKIPDMLAEIAPVTFLVEEIPELEGDERKEVLVAMLARVGRTLYNPTALAVLQKKSSGNALFLEMTAQLLNMIATPELAGLQTPQEIIPLTVRLVNGMPDDTQEAVSHIFDVARAILCIDGDKISEAMNLLAVSPRGLRLSDLQELLGEKFNSLDWALIRKFLYNFYTEHQGGQIDLSHGIIREGLRRKIDVKTFKSLEKQISEYIKTLPPGDFLHLQCAYYFAQKTGDYNFAAELYTEANATREPLLLFDIYEAIRSDGGAFCLKFIEKLAMQDVDTIDAVFGFFAGEFQEIMLNGSKSEFEIAREVFKKFSTQVKSLDYFYYLFKKCQAAFEWRLNDIKMATEICEEIIHWGETHTELSDDLIFCRILSNTYQLLTLIKHDSGKSDKEKDYFGRCIYWMRKATVNDETSDADAWKFVLKMNESVQKEKFTKSNETVLEIYRPIYLELKNALEDDPDNVLKLSATATECAKLIHENLSQGKFAEVLALVTEGKNYIKLLLQKTSNNLDFMKMGALLLTEISLAELRAMKESIGDDGNLLELVASKAFQDCCDNCYEAERLLTAVYSANSTKENLDYLQGTADKISYTIHELFGDILGL